MNFRKTTLILALLTFILTISAISEAKEEKDFAVPAFSDLPLLGGQNVGGALVHQEGWNPLSYVKQKQWLDLNRDLQLNDFDVKQFQSIIENLNGEKLTGLQLTIRFKAEQKNQRESFPLLYDLDRDGLFTSFDVDRFSEAINKLDEGATRGSELIQKYRFEIFPQIRKR